MTSTTEAAFRTTLMVGAPIERAFTVFTAGIGTWWPKAHHIGKAELADVVIEGDPGGRWFERNVDGSECEWGRVLAWEPPRRVVLAWHLNADFEFDPDPERASRVEVRFTATGERSTRVDFEHADLDRVGERWPGLLREISEKNGWPFILEHFTASAAA